MRDLQPIFLVQGFLLTTLGLAMALPALIDFADQAVDDPFMSLAAQESWIGFAVSAMLTLFVGMSLLASAWGQGGQLTRKQAFLLTTVSWVVLVAFAALPFVFSSIHLNYTDAFFEAMSGLTTTGSTIITDLERASRGIKMWRSLLQWLGGIGIIVMAIAVLPMLQVGGMQLFRLESSDTSEKILPRATQIAGSITALYFALTAICAGAYWAAGMNLFDSLAHAMTTIATGGFSTHDLSIGYFESPPVEVIAIVFMIVGSLPFALYIHAVRGNPLPLLRDSQVLCFFGIVATAIGLLTLYQLSTSEIANGEALRSSAFNAVSIITGTGYASTDYSAWGPFAIFAFFAMMFIGGCAGSTSCGIKIFRFQIIYGAVKVQVSRLMHPHGIFKISYNGEPVSEKVVDSVASFFFLFFASFAILSVLLATMVDDPLTAFSAAGTALANVGPGLGSVGPADNFFHLSDGAKWLLSLGMLLGRLELFTVLVLFSPTFWRI
ncbi:MAG: TrkH family potassium uptake protein [Pseudomonadota bacterium]